MDVDEIFKLPALPKSSVNKRKAIGNPSLEQLSKTARLSTDTDVSSASNEASTSNGSTATKSTKARVSNGSDSEGEDVVVPNDDFAPGGDADYFAEEDDEGGRFFGGGLTSEQKQIIQILDTDTNVDTEEGGGMMTLPECRRTLLNLEKSINKNREMRTKHEREPAKFVDSEIALDAALGSLLLLTQDVATFYPEIVRLGVAGSLVDLLSHENVDIAIAAVKVIEELTDEDVGEGVEDEDAFLSALDMLISEMLKSSLPDLLSSNTSRLNSADDAEAQGLYHSFGVIENLLSSSQADTAAALILKTPLPSFLINSIAPTKEKASAPQESNRYYAAELLSILLSSGSQGSEARTLFLEKKGLDASLQVLSAYRKRDPRGTEELEFMENVFDLLCQCLGTEEGKKAFREEEGVELMVILMKEKKMARTRSIKVLDFAMSAEGEGAATCALFVEALGLKTLFPAFMGKGGKKENALSTEDIEHLLGILSSLFSSLESDTPPRVRLMTKFVSDDYEKVDRLLEIREAAESRVSRWKGVEGVDLDADEMFLGKLENGLATLQLADYVLAWIAMEDDGVRDHAKMLLSRKGKDFQDVISVLEEYAANIEGDDGTEGATKRDIIGNLMNYLDGC